MRALIVISTTLALLATAAVDAFEPPKRRSGLWEMTTSSLAGKGGAMSMQVCVDEKTDSLAFEKGVSMAKQHCSRNDFRHDGDRLVVDSVCKFGDTTATTTTVFTGKFDSGYRADSKVIYDPPMRGLKEATNVIDARWTGPCKPGQKPGDVVMPGLGTVNMHDVMKNSPKN